MSWMLSEMPLWMRLQSSCSALNICFTRVINSALAIANLLLHFRRSGLEFFKAHLSNNRLYLFLFFCKNVTHTWSLKKIRQECTSPLFFCAALHSNDGMPNRNHKSTNIYSCRTQGRVSCCQITFPGENIIGSFTKFAFHVLFKGLVPKLRWWHIAQITSLIQSLHCFLCQW